MKIVELARGDWFESNFRLALLLALQDVRDTYSRSALGPVWITLGLGAQTTVIALVFGLALEVSISDFLPHLAVGLVLWNFVTSTINESTLAFTQLERLIKQLRVPLVVPVLRVLLKNILFLAHNLAIVGASLLVAPPTFSWGQLLIIPGLILIFLSLFGAASIVALLATRYRDIGPIVGSFMTISFYGTPIIWKPENLPDFAEAWLWINPFYHLIEIFRGPLLLGQPSGISWGICLVGGILLLSMAAILNKNFGWKIPYWV